MIVTTTTDHYLKDLDTLTEILYLCWHNSYCYINQAIDNNKLIIQLQSYGYHTIKRENKKKLPESFRNNLIFKNLPWVNEFINAQSEHSLFETSQQYKKVIKEIECNLFLLKTEAEKIAYAKIILRDIDKNNIHKKEVDEKFRNLKFKEMFINVLKQDSEATDLAIRTRLFNHLCFIEKLIELFLFFEINLISLSKTLNFNLFTFDDNNIEIHEPISIDENILPKFNSSLSDDCLIKVMLYLTNKKLLVCPNSDSWLYWFNRKYVRIPEPLKWVGSPTKLSNIIQQLCNECVSGTIKIAFDTNDFVKPTRKVYENSQIYKEIEQIIIIAKQKFH